MKHLSRILALALAVLMLSSAALAEIPAYLNVGKTPLVNEDITLTVAVRVHDNTQKPDETWMTAYIEKVLGINVDIEMHFVSAARDESIALMMADNDLPDLILGAGFTASELTQYGAINGQLLDLAPYMTAENAPNLTAIYAAHPEYVSELMNPDGAVYSVGYINEDATGSSGWKMFYNYDWLEACNLEVPTTLDEFLNMLRTFKKYGAENGIENCTPFGGNYARYNATYFILNALGFNHTQNSGQQRSFDTDIMLRNGKIVMPAYDREMLPVYLEFMRTLYEEGLMEQDYWTLDKETTKAHLVSGRYGTFSEIPGLYGGIEFGQQWFGVQPLTSEYNATPFWPNYSQHYIGAAVVSAKTEHPELCVAFLDHFYGEDVYRMFTNNGNTGPSVNQPELWLDKTTGWFLNENGEHVTQEYLDNASNYSAYIYWKYENLYLWSPNSFGMSRSDGLGVLIDENGNAVSTYPTAVGETLMEQAKVRKQANNTTMQKDLSLYYGMNSYRTSEFTPTVCYFDEDTTLRIDELKTLIDEYANAEIAKFIMGTRPLSELDDYFAEMDKLNAAEYVQYYADYYASMQK